MEKKLYRKKEGRVLAGVCAGIADYFSIDPTIVRIIWLLCNFAFGTGVLAYLVCALVIPEG